MSLIHPLTANVRLFLVHPSVPHWPFNSGLPLLSFSSNYVLCLRLQALYSDNPTCKRFNPIQLYSNIKTVLQQSSNFSMWFGSVRLPASASSIIPLILYDKSGVRDWVPVQYHIRSHSRTPSSGYSLWSPALFREKSFSGFPRCTLVRRSWCHYLFLNHELIWLVNLSRLHRVLSTSLSRQSPFTLSFTSS